MSTAEEEFDNKLRIFDTIAFVHCVPYRTLILIHHPTEAPKRECWDAYCEFLLELIGVGLLHTGNILTANTIPHKDWIEELNQKVVKRSRNVADKEKYSVDFFLHKPELDPITSLFITMAIKGMIALTREKVTSTLSYGTFMDRLEIPHYHPIEAVNGEKLTILKAIPYAQAEMLKKKAERKATNKKGLAA